MVFLACLVPALALLAATQLWPLLQSLNISLHDWTLSRSPVMGEWVGLANYRKVFTDPQFSGSAAFTVMLALGSTALSMAAGLGLAMLVAGDGGRLRAVRTLLLLPMVIAPVAAGTIWRMMLAARVGPINAGLQALGIPAPNWLGDPLLARISLVVIDAWQWTPFVMIIMAAALVSIPTEVVRAASMDGAGRWYTFRRIVFPMVLPVFVLVGIFRAIEALMTLDMIFTTTGGGPGFATQTLSYWIYMQGLRYFNMSYAAAASWILLVGLMLIALGLLAWRRHISSWQVAR
jgi:ABC-type sugar transport system permease subunit